MNISLSKFKNTPFVLLQILIWLFIITAVVTNYYHSGATDRYLEVHFPMYFLFAGTSALGYNMGFDIINQYIGFVSNIVGFPLKFIGISLPNLYLVGSFFAIIRLIFVYKISRFILSRFWAYLSLIILASVYTGGQVWFNDIIMTFVIVAAYLMLSYIYKPKDYKLYITGFIIFLLPFMRHQAIIQTLVFLIFPIILYYLRFIDKEKTIYITKRIGFTFLSFNIIFLIYLLIAGKFLTFFYSYFLVMGSEFFNPIVAVTDNSKNVLGSLYVEITQLFKAFFDYSTDYYEYYPNTIGGTRFLYWIIILLPAIFYFVRPIYQKVESIKLSEKDIVRFFVAMITVSTLVFNFPNNDEHRHIPQFSIATWLLIDALFLIFYNNKIKKFSIFLISFLMFILHIDRVVLNYDIFVKNAVDLVKNERHLYTYPSGSAFSGLRVTQDVKAKIDKELGVLRFLESEIPGIPVIYDGISWAFLKGEENNTPVFIIPVALYLSAKNPGLQHNYPFYLTTYRPSSESRLYLSGLGEVFDIKNKHYTYLEDEKPIVIGRDPVLNENFIRMSDYIYIHKDRLDKSWIK